MVTLATGCFHRIERMTWVSRAISAAQYYIARCTYFKMLTKLPWRYRVSAPDLYLDKYFNVRRIGIIVCVFQVLANS